MIDPFPVISDNRQLTDEDFSRFSTSFAGILKKRLPTATQVFFCRSVSQLRQILPEEEDPAALIELFDSLDGAAKSCGITEKSLMLAFNLKDDAKIVAVVTGGDDIFHTKVSADWLLEVKESVLLEFLLLKQARVDISTGLLNLANLYSLLETHGTRKDVQLILLELPPRRSSFQSSLRYAQKCTAVLQALIQKDSVLHYLGHCTFALILANDSGHRQEIGGVFVSYLKREGCHRVHIGCSSVHEDQGEHRKYPGTQLLDEAWAALKQAKKRGPFSFCNYASLADPEKHPLSFPDRNIIRRINRISAGDDKFSLVLFRGDTNTQSAKKIVPAHVDSGIVVETGDDVIVYLTKNEGSEALDWARRVIAQLKTEDEAAQVSAGVSCFPYGDFKRSEMVINCKKALLHAAFFGHSSAVLFDAVSLNISGDIYFSEGDLTKAVKEYRRGLKSDSRNVNLHNSLGVALAMMNKLSPAMKSFENGLRVDPDNFMALYNLGLAEQARDRNGEALVYFQKALKNHGTLGAQKENVHELKLQIGILSCELGHYKQAIDYLVPWYESNSNAPRAGRISYYIGRAYYGVAEKKKATGYLQKALRFDEFDDRAMNLLGQIYLAENEGDDIALSLLRKSVELEPSRTHYRLHLAMALLQCGLCDEARDVLYYCLRYRSSKVEAQLLMAKTCLQEGRGRRAATWCKKVVANENAAKELRGAALKMLAQIRIEEKNSHV
ncbi:MAG: tetratricopeptide repeat protein [Desulforhopalus sp.]